MPDSSDVFVMRAGNTVCELDAERLITLDSMLRVHEECEREAARGPVYGSTRFSRSSGFPRRVRPLPTLGEMLDAASCDARMVLLTLEHEGNVFEHECQVTVAWPHAGMFAIEPPFGEVMMPGGGPSDNRVRTGSGKRDWLPRVTGCELLPTSITDAMKAAAKSDVIVLLTLESDGAEFEHACRVEAMTVNHWAIRPEFNGRSAVRVGDGPEPRPRVTACGPLPAWYEAGKSLDPNSKNPGPGRRWREALADCICPEPAYEQDPACPSAHDLRVPAGRLSVVADGRPADVQAEWDRMGASIEAGESPSDVQRQSTDCAAWVHRERLDRYTDLRKALGVLGAPSWDAMLRRVEMAAEVAKSGVTAKEVERLRRFEDGVTELAVSLGLPRTGTDLVLNNLRTVVGEPSSPAPGYTVRNDERLGWIYDGKLSGRKNDGRSRAEAVSETWYHYGWDDAVEFVSKPLAATNPVPTSKGFYWAKVPWKGQPCEWQIVEVLERCPGVLGFTIERSDGFEEPVIGRDADHVTWGPRIEPPTESTGK